MDAAKLTWQAISNIKQWISGARCAKNIVDSVSLIGAGIRVGIGGAALGALLLEPVGAFVEGLAGGAVASVFELSINRIDCDGLQLSQHSGLY